MVSLSIAIPTKDRYDTLFPVLRALLKYIVGMDYEIIVQDNTLINDIALEKIQEINDEKINYYHSSDSLSVSENSDLAISHCTGKYLTFIGDDDLISPYILEIIKKVDTESLDCLIYEKGNYFWDFLKMDKEYAFHYPASLSYSKELSVEIKKLSVKKELQFTLDAGGDSNYHLPSLYHGIVKKEVMKKVKEKFGSFVPGSCPDIAISTALSCVVQEYGFMCYPVTIAGASNKSAAGMGVRNAHIARIEDVPWLPKDIINKWNPKIPRIWTGMTIYAQNIHEVFMQAGINTEINYNRLYSNMYIKEPQTKKIVLPFIISFQKNLFAKGLSILTNSVKAISFNLLYSLPSCAINARYFLKGDFKRKVQHKNVKTVDDCMLHLTIFTNVF